MTMTLRKELLKLASDHPELRKDLVPILRKTAGMSRVRDLGSERVEEGYTQELALENVRQYAKWSREIMKLIDLKMRHFEQMGLGKGMGSTVWTRVSTAYEIANQLGKIEESFL